MKKKHAEANSKTRMVQNVYIGFGAILLVKTIDEQELHSV